METPAGMLIIWLDAQTNNIAIHGGGSVDAQGNVTAGKVLLTLGDGRIGGDTGRHATIKLDDGVKISESLKFESLRHTNPGNYDRGIGYDISGSVYVKTPRNSNDFHYQAGGRVIFSATSRGIRLPYDTEPSGTGYPAFPGEMIRRGNDLIVNSGGALRNLSNLPSVTIRRGVQLPGLLLQADPTASALDRAFGSAAGSIGYTHDARALTAVINNPEHNVMWIKDGFSYDWHKFEPTAHEGAAGTAPHGISETHRKIRTEQGTSVLPTSVLSPEPSLGDPIIYAQSGTGVTNRAYRLLITNSIYFMYYASPTATVAGLQGTSGAGDLLHHIPYADIDDGFGGVYTVADLNMAFGNSDGTLGFEVLPTADPTVFKGSMFSVINAQWYRWDLTSFRISR